MTQRRKTYRAWPAGQWREAAPAGPDLTGVLRWSVPEGAEVGPHAEVCAIETSTMALSVSVDSFSSVVERLVPEGGTVKPDEPLFVVLERAPTADEWDRERDRAQRAERETRAERSRGPIAAFWRALRRR